MAQTARSTRSSSALRSARTTQRPAKPVSQPRAKADRAKASSSVPSPKASPAKLPNLTPVKGGASSVEAPRTTGAPLRGSKPVPPPAPEQPKRVSQVVPRGYVPLVDIPPLPPPPKNMVLTVGDKAVHPAHGLGEVIAIEHREIGGAKGEFYILRILDNGLRVMVPRTAAAA